MFTTYFSALHLFVFLIILLIHIGSIYFFVYKKDVRIAIVLLFIGGIIFRCLMISFDDFFHTWDEQYHALVAKHMVENPIVPVLYKYPLLEYDPNNWTSNYIWLHKQPMFLWQMAASIKLFGATAIAIRIPSMIMWSLLILIIYRIGKITLGNNVGYLSAFLYGTCNYFLEFVTGIISTDHNDIAFIFYVSLSIWAYTEYCVFKKQKYIWLIGLFVGFAVLNKWLVGLLVFSGWGIFLLFFVAGWKNKLSEFKLLIKAALISACIFLPWQIYILLRFPAQSKYEFAYNSKHFFEAVENHSGDHWYYFDQAVIQYGFITAILLPIALIFMFKKIQNIKIRISYIVFITITYVFFTLSKTKMPAFCLVVSPLFFLALGNGLSWLTDLVSKQQSSNYLIKLGLTLSLITIGFVNIDIETIQRSHTTWKTKDTWAYFREQLIEVRTICDSIKGKYDKHKTVIFNCASTQNIPIMFYSDYLAYDKIPSSKELSYLKKLNYTVLYIDPYSSVPEHIKNDKNIIYIPNPERIEKSNKKVIFLAWNNQYVCDDGQQQNKVFANRKIGGLWETFSLIEFEKNNSCAIRSWTNRFLCADLGANNEIIANRGKISGWELFTLIHLDSNVVAFKAYNDRYLTVSPSTQLFATSEFIGPKEKFRIVTVSN
jgi:4-amino-4-deoxy-L-arabinose transferase